MNSSDSSALSVLLRTMLSGRSPQATAVVCGDRQLTYGELESRTNQLAHILHQANLPPSTRVGVYLDRSLDIVVAILGILKAGLAYVPLDPHYPSDRIDFIAQETQYAILLSHIPLSDRLPHQPTAQVIYLDDPKNKIDQQPTTAPVLSCEPELAYVMYTSGSTGKPKGVKMPRANIVRYITALAQILPLQESDRYLHVASFSFSSSVRQLFLPLYAGATVVLATRDQTKNPLLLFQLMQQQYVTVSDGVASIWRYALQLMDPSSGAQLDPANLHLRHVILSGENTPIVLFQGIRRALGDRVHFFNVYGQTETIGNTAYAVPPDLQQSQGYLPVGYPYPHNQVYVLDPNLNPVPDGEIGELYISGGCLAQGYLNRDDLTAEKFIEQPWETGPDRIFNTGDVVRRQADGCLELLGRTDFQVKIRGMRVELDEISAILEQHPQVTAAATAAYESATGDTVVVGYIVPASPDLAGHSWSTLLRPFLAEHLPDYMVPSFFMELESLPKTPSGKLDRPSLPKPSFLDNAAVEIQSDSPIQAIFCKAFRLSAVGAEDTFISLGGHSLLYVQFSIELERYLGFLPNDWENMTVAKLEQVQKRDTLLPRMETTLVLRAFTICAIVANHAKLVPVDYIQGGSNILLIIAGLNFARFQSKNLVEGNYHGIVNTMFFSMVMPYMILEMLFQLYTKNFMPSAFLLVNNFVTPFGTGFLFSWFVDIYVQCIALLMLLSAIPKVRQFIQQRPWIFSVILLSTAAVASYVGPLFWDTAHLMHFVPHMYLWIFLLGWTIQYTRSPLQKFSITILLVFLTLVVDAIILFPSQYVWMLACVPLIIWTKSLPMPRPLILPIEILGGASYYIYLVHLGAFHVAEKLGLYHPLVDIVFGLLGGVGFWWIIQTLQKRSPHWETPFLSYIFKRKVTPQP